MPMRGETGDAQTSSLANLSRTLETLELRLDKLASNSRHRSAAPADLPPPPPSRPVAAPMPYQGDAPPPQLRRTLSDAVSELVMHRRMLDDAAGAKAARAAEPAAAPRHDATFGHNQSRPEGRADPSFRNLADEVETLKAEGSNYALMAEVAEELQRLRQELQAGGSSRSDPRFDEMRQAFDDLRRMMEARESADLIGAELSHVSNVLTRLTEEGADRATLNTLRAELEEMRNQFSEMARETTIKAVGLRWDEFETRHAAQAERDVEAKRDLKQELERLRESLRSLASEDHVRAVERRWDDFETRYLDAGQAQAEPAISELLRQELEGMREKLDGIAEAAPLKAVEKRWTSLEERLDSREVETSIQHLSERMGEIEAMLARLPESLGLAPLEARLHSLAMSVDAFTHRGDAADLDHFVVLEERLDEISRAIVATSLQPPPVLDMAPIERIEARIATLTTRVDRFTDEKEADMLSARIAELSDRVEELARNPVADELAARMASLTERLESAFAEMEQPQIDVAAVEARLSALALRLEDAVQPQVDPGILASLEGQIARLSQHLAHADAARDADVDPDFDRRLAAIEQRLDDNRESLIAAARQAAEDTALRMQEAGDRRQGEHVAQLSESLRALEALSRHTDGRSNQVFDAVHSTLLKIVDRLEQIETDVNRNAPPEAVEARDATRIDRAAAHLAAAGVEASEAARAETAGATGLRRALARHLPGRAAPETAAAAAAADHRLLDRREPDFADEERQKVAAPSLDASGMIDQKEANRPLEPGSGAPDIGALLERVRLKQRSMASGAGDAAGTAATVAAANRAARAAAAEAEKLRSPSDDDAPAGKRFSLRELLSRRRKTVLACVAAVLAVLSVLPIGEALVSGETAAAPEAGAPTPALQGAAAPSLKALSGKAPTALADAGTKAPLGKPAPATPAAAAAVKTPPASPAKDDASLPASASPSTVPAAAAVPNRGSAALPPPTTPAAGSPAPERALPASAAAAAVPAGETPDQAAVLAGAVSKLPPAAAAGIPSVPPGIATPALAEAAAAGNPKALFEIGLRLMEGRSGEPKPAEAVRWFAEAGRRGFAPAQYSLGTLFEKGNGVARDGIAARDWYLLAAMQGNVRAMHNLAVLYATGIDGKSDPETAARWFEDAAEHGMRDSQYNLGILYAQGSGVELDMAQSYKWFSIVARSGDKDAEAKRDEIAKHLPPAKLKAAEASVAGWAPKPQPEAANTVDIPKEWSDPKADQTASVDMARVIRNIQAILGKLGYDVGTPDGVAGEKTKLAIMAFQRERGLKPDGAISAVLIRTLLERKNG